MDEDPIGQHQTLVIVMRRIALAAAMAMFAGCAAPSNAPKGWQPIAGRTNAWTTGSGSAAQEYRYDDAAFGGSLSDLASQTTIDVLTRYPGARFQRSIPFAPCPGTAGVQTFALRNGVMLQEAFSVHKGRAIRIRYLRPAETPVDSSTIEAMQRTLCTL
jgi:hypothetical protein